MYLCDWAHHKKGRQDLELCPPEYSEGPLFFSFPMAWWFLALYVRDVIQAAIPVCSDDVYIWLHLEIDSMKRSAGSYEVQLWRQPAGLLA